LAGFKFQALRDRKPSLMLIIVQHADIETTLIDYI